MEIINPDPCAISIISKILDCLKKYDHKSLCILNLGYPLLQESLNIISQYQIIENNNPALNTPSFIVHQVQQQYYDLIVGIDGSLFNESNIAESELVTSIANNSDISIYKFPSFQTYFANPIFKKIYKYREVIPRQTQEIYVFCSNSYWYADGKISKFIPQTKLTRERVGTISGERRYYFNAEHILKYYELNGGGGDHIKREIEAEARFLLEDNATHGFAPKLIDFKTNAYEGWILREQAPGVTLSEILDENKDYDPLAIFNHTLQQVILLEKKNLVHIKLRPRNIIVLETGGALLIDYGAIFSKHKQKFSLSSYYGFLILSYEIFHRKHIAEREFSPFYLMDAEDVHPHYQRWIKLILSYPTRLWNFELFSILFSESESSQDIVCKIDNDHFQHWLRKMQQLIANKKINLLRFETLVANKINSYHDSYPEKVLYLLGKKIGVLYNKLSAKLSV